MPPAAVASGYMTNCRASQNTGLKAFLLIYVFVHCIFGRHAFQCSAAILEHWVQSMFRNVLKIKSMCVAPFIPSPLLFSLLLWNSCSPCVSTRSLWWRQPVDDTGQQTAEAYRPSRAKGGVLSFNLSIPSPLLSFLLFSSTSCILFFASSLHNGHLVFTSLA